MPVLQRRLLSRLVWLVASIAGPTASWAATTTPLSLPNIGTSDRGVQPAAALTAADEALLDDLERASFRFFVEQSHPITGLVRDRARADGSPSDGKASIAASGFALTAWAIATERGWIDRASAIDRCRKQLRFLATKAPRVHGFFYHFMDMDTGARAWKCELSTIDTGLFLAGAITAREYFQDPEITTLVNQLYRDVDWSWFLNGGQTFAMGWYDETGFSRFRWIRYSELMMLTLLGLGAPEHPMPPQLWYAWERGPVGDYAGYHYIQFPSLFAHQFTQAYVDFRGLRDAYADYYHNSVLATLAQRQFCADLSGEFPTWSNQMWGLTASDSANGYKGGWGGPPRTLDDIALDGTLVPCAAAGSVTFTPRESMAVLHAMRITYGDRLWKRYGFADAFNPETGWINPDVIGIDLGIQLAQAENARTGFVTRTFMRAPEVRQALIRAGFLSTDRNLTHDDREAIRTLAAQCWQSLETAPLKSETAGLQLTALVAARTLGLVPGLEATSRATEALHKLTAVPTRAPLLAQYAAGLVLVRQAFPSLTTQAAARLAAINWDAVRPDSNQLGSFNRLAVFFQVAAGARTAAAWSGLVRTPEWLKPVYVLAPARPEDQLLPSLWLDENAIITGASAAQFAYARALEYGAPAQPRLPDPITLALLIDHFPAVAAAMLRADPAMQWLKAATLADRAVLLTTATNLLVPNSIRATFQRDALVQTGRAAIGEFGAAKFGDNCSDWWRDELAGPPVIPPAREAVAVSAQTPRDQWHWVQVEGLEYKDSVADVRPGDPALSLRFAFTWDNDALYFHADVTDGLPKVVPRPSDRNGVELFMNPPNDGLVWGADGSYQFTFRRYGTNDEAFHHCPMSSTLQPTPRGYTVEAKIAWRNLGLTPHPGLEIALSPAVMSSGTAEWEPAFKLNWRYYQRADGRYGLGMLRLE